MVSLDSSPKVYVVSECAERKIWFVNLVSCGFAFTNPSPGLRNELGNGLLSVCMKASPFQCPKVSNFSRFSTGLQKFSRNSSYKFEFSWNPNCNFCNCTAMHSTSVLIKERTTATVIGARSFLNLRNLETFKGISYV